MSAAFLTALYLRFHYYDFLRWASKYGSHYWNLLIATMVIYLILHLYYKDYYFPRRFKPTYVIPRITQMMLITMLASVMLIFLSKGLSRTTQVFHYSRPTMAAFWILSFGYICAARFALGILQLRLFRSGHLQRSIIVVGEGIMLRNVEERLRLNRWFGARVVQKVVVRPGGPPPDGEGILHLSGADDLVDLIHETGAHEIFLALPASDLPQLFETIEAVRRTGSIARIIPGHLQLVIGHLLLSEVSPVPDRTKEDLVFELYKRANADFELELATVAIIGAKGIPPTFGGIEHHVAELTNRLATMGFFIKVYSRPYYTNMEGRFHGVEILRLPTIHTKHLDAITHTFLATFHALFQRVDIAHYHAQGPSLLSYIPRLFGVRTVVTIHGLDWKREKWGGVAKYFLRMGEVSSVKCPNRTIAVSRTLQKYHEKKYDRPVDYIPNGIQLKNIPGSDGIREQFDLEPDSYLLLVGRLVPEKGCHYLIEAFRKVKTEKKLVVAGGSSHSDEYMQNLHELAEGDDRVRFLGYVYGEALDELYAHSYLYVQPSDLEGLSIALLEALSFGTAVLVSDIDENLEAICDEDTPEEAWNAPPSPSDPPVGFRFRQGDIEDLTRTLQRLVDNPREMEPMRQKAREWIRLRYDWDLIAADTAALYHEIAHK